MADEEIKPPQGAYVTAGVYGDPEALTRAEDLVDEKAEPETSGPKNGFSLNSAPMVKMCHSCGFLHRDFRAGATPDDASLCAKCVAKGIEEPARYVA